MTKVAPGVMKNALAGTSQTRAYSMQVTTNQPITGRNHPPEYKNLPVDSIILIGHQGQLVVASPSQKLVIVRLATDKGSSFERKKFFAEVKSFLENKNRTLEVAIETHKSFYESELQPITAQGEEGKGKWTDYFRVPKLMRTLAAKEYCSCLHVVKRSKKQCDEDIKVSLPLLPFIKSKKKDNKQMVYASFIPGVRAEAEYVNEQMGCRLVK